MRITFSKKNKSKPSSKYKNDDIKEDNATIETTKDEEKLRGFIYYELTSVASHPFQSR